MVSLDELFAIHGSQKCTGDTAHYAELYERYIDRSRVRTMLEQGVANGGSIMAWRKWFGPGVTIYGTDKKKTRAWDMINERGTLLRVVDQANAKEIRRAFEGLQFDLIVDDAGHHMLPQQIALRTLWPQVSPGGWYVIEDLHSSYWPAKGGGYRRLGTTMDYLKQLCDYPTHWAYLHSQRAEHLREKRPPSNLEKTLGELHFHPSIVFLRKRPA